MAERKKLKNYKPSGAQNRKRKAEEEKSLSKLKDSFLKYLPSRDPKILKQELKNGDETLKLPQNVITTKTENVVAVTEIASTSTFLASVSPSASTSTFNQLNMFAETNQHREEELLGNLSAANLPENDINYSDPGTWSIHNDKFRQLLVEHGPIQLKDFNFPVDHNKRKFSNIHYKRRLVNGEYLNRLWLLYSRSKNAVFCFCCMFFSKTASRSTLSTIGVNDWKNISAILGSHEKSSDHVISFQEWKELEVRLKRNKTIDEQHLRIIREEEKFWHQILERLIALVRVLGAQNLALRGSEEKLFTKGNGNFLKFLEYLALFDPVMQEHLRRVHNKETHIHYLGKNIQNELIKLLSDAVQNKILSAVRNAKYYAIVLDCTPDQSHVEQMTIILRFVLTSDGKKCEIKEHFLGFVPVADTSGTGLTSTVLEKIEKMSLSLTNLRAQGYDNGSNMKGKNVGLQRRILDMNPRAFYVPCSSHSLNLVINDAAKCCLPATFFFCIVQNLFVFFAGSTKRWEVLMRHLPSLTLKPLSNTRWESRIDALNPLRYQLSEVHEALMDIVEDPNLTGSSGNVVKAEAQGLAKNIGNFKFVVSLVVWHNILYEINLTSKLLQSQQFDLAAATNQLCTTKKFLVNCRSDVGFQKFLADAREIAEEFGIPTEFEPESIPKRLKKKKRQFLYEAEDEPMLDANQQFKVNFYFAILDTAISSIDERFNQMEKISNVFGFLYHIDALDEKPSRYILDECIKLEKELTHDNSKDIDASELCSELQAVSRRVPKNSTPRDVLDFICNTSLQESVPNLSIALRILLTLPVSVASGERSFSKLKLIKTYLRSSMTQERLVGLATLSIEQEIAQTIDLSELVSTFSKQKARKKKI